MDQIITKEESIPIDEDTSWKVIRIHAVLYIKKDEAQRQKVSQHRLSHHTKVAYYDSSTISQHYYEPFLDTKFELRFNEGKLVTAVYQDDRTF